MLILTGKTDFEVALGIAGGVLTDSGDGLLVKAVLETVAIAETEPERSPRMLLRDTEKRASRSGLCR